MSKSDSVRFSRDGDQFHYLWAARRCLLLLSPTSGLVAVSIEGASEKESATDESLEAGEELIDVGEYYGSEAVETAALIRYIQLKHSTQRTHEPWPPSGLEKTLRGFANRYIDLEQRLGGEALAGRIEFSFVSNRPINPYFMEAIEDAAAEAVNRYPKDLEKLKKFTSLEGEKLAAFCRLLRLEGGQETYWFQRGVLAQEINAYLPGNDVDAPGQLKELVTRKALSESANDRSITKIDVLRALGTDEDGIFPAPSRIETIGNFIPRDQEADLVAQIVSASTPIIVHAAGGVGKSVLSQRIGHRLPKGSVVITYDCFGNGEYRRSSSLRHRHKDALVQIANELATLGLCDPLIPSPTADNTDYLRVFLYRVKQSVAAIKTKNEQALLCVAIDAADNAQMAAEEIGEPRSFARDLLREQMPDGMRLVTLCRTHRQYLLDPPPNALCLELQPFNRAETAIHLRHVFPKATEQDVDEFHRLSSQNPRVQAMALFQQASLNEILRKLGPNPTTAEDAIASLLDSAIANLRDKAGRTEQAQVDSICSGLAALRPLVPIHVLASISGVTESAIKSFAVDLGRPLIVIGDTIQFFDEPAETWFREKFRPIKDQLAAFIATLKPLASKSAYVASALPQLMLEAGQFSDLVELALSSEGLPAGSPVEKRDVEVQRLQFALKASLRAKRYADAAKLALKAGEETAGDRRQQELLQENTDLAAVLMEPDQIQEIVSRRTFGGGWIGAHHAYEAGLLSHFSAFQGDARSRLRMAYEWLRNWSRLSKAEQVRDKIDDRDIAEIAIARFNIDGPEACAAEMRRWSPRDVSYRVGCIVARRWIDHGRYDALGQLAVSATNDIYLLLAINFELRAVHRSPPKETIGRALRLVLHNRVKIIGRSFDNKGTDIQAIVALVESAYAYHLRDNEVLASLLDRYLPDIPSYDLTSRYGGHRFPLLMAYALRAALRGKDLKLLDLARPDIRRALEEEKSHYDSQDVQVFKEDIGGLLPWLKLWAENFISPISSVDLATAIAAVRENSASATRMSYRDVSFTSDEVAEIWFDILVSNGSAGETLIPEFRTWIGGLKRPLFTSTWTKLARIAARVPNFASHANDFARRAFDLMKDAREDAVSKAQTFVELSRAIVSLNKAEAGAYFNQAIEVASKLGDEILDRWQSTLDLAYRAADPSRPVPKTAYQLARCAELVYEYVDRDKHYDWEGTITAIADLCPSSCFAILSRWRDRKFGSVERLLATAVHHLLKQQRIDPRTTPALVGFRAQWKYATILGLALPAYASQSERQNALSYILHYLLLDGQSSAVWEELGAIAAANDLLIPNFNELIAFAKLSEVSRLSENSTISFPGKSDDKEGYKEKDWDTIFSGLELFTAEGISAAYARFHTYEPPFYLERFASELFSHVPEGRQAECVRALAEPAEFSLYAFQGFLEQLPLAWRSQMAICSALADIIKRICRRHCMEITKSRHYQLLPLRTASELSGIPEQDLIDVVLAAIGETNDIVGSSRLFTLVGLLASKLTHDEARDVLHFGLSLFDDVLDGNDGDGPWTMALEPPRDINAAIAGYIWGGLAAPKASLRWEAAHVVRGLCALGQHAVLGHLVKYAESGLGGVFADARLHFYHLHARQWLMIALARVAMENPAAVVSIRDFLIRFALNDEPHVLIRHFAVSAVLSLAESGHSMVDTNVRDQLSAVNSSSLPFHSSKRYQRPRKHSVHQEIGTKRFIFGYDMDRYWFERLGDCFAKTSSDVEIEAEIIICDDWKLEKNGHWDNDERAQRGLFRDHEHSHSHSSYPRTDDLSFYLSYHSMMIVAGKWLAAFPLHCDPEYFENEFEEWLKGHLLSRQDGCWLADRRDPKPLEWPNWKNDKQSEDWQWSVVKSDFDRLLGLGDDRLNLWGHWTMLSGRYAEVASIRSALVTPERSYALLSALQTATNSRDYLIPNAGDDLEIDKPDFKLIGWVETNYAEKGLDQFDPWAGEIRYPAPKPAQFANDIFQLEPDREFRVWQGQSEGALKEVLWSQVWGSCKKEDNEDEGENGQRLQASRAFLIEFLGKMKMDLIVEVEIERRIRRSRYERYKDDGIEYPHPYTKLFLFDSDGKCRSLR